MTWLASIFVAGALLLQPAVGSGDDEAILLRSEALLRNGRAARTPGMLVDAACLRAALGVRDMVVNGDTLTQAPEDTTAGILAEAERMQRNGREADRIAQARQAHALGTLADSSACRTVVATLPRSTDQVRALTGPVRLAQPLPPRSERSINLPVEVGVRLLITAASGMDGEVTVTLVDPRYPARRLCRFELRRARTCIVIPDRASYRLDLRNDAQFPTLVTLFFR